jgi:co-chaperonin GroES (HSP10)
MGEDAYNREDMSKPWCKLGDHVMFAKYAGHRFQFGKTELRIMNDDEILGLVPDIKNIS